jgi:hypothetical protein
MPASRSTRRTPSSYEAAIAIISCQAAEWRPVIAAEAMEPERRQPGGTRTLLQSIT